MMELKMIWTKQLVIDEIESKLNEDGIIFFSKNKPSYQWIIEIIEKSVKNWNQTYIDKLINNIVETVNNTYTVEMIGDPEGDFLETIARKETYLIHGKEYKVEYKYISPYQDFKYAIVRKSDNQSIGEYLNFGDVKIALYGTSPNKYYILENTNHM